MKKGKIKILYISKNIKSWFFLMAIGSLFLSCGGGKRDVEHNHLKTENDIEKNIAKIYGTAYNDTRKEIGLPILNAEWGKYWKVIKADPPAIYWKNPKKEEDKPYYYSKKIVYKRDTIISETNRYSGIKEYRTADGSFKEILSITYNFEKNKKGNVGFVYTLRSSSGYPNDYDSDTVYTKSHTLTKEEADSILISWNIFTLKQD